MQTNDTYKTISAPSEGIYKEKGSKFLAYAYPVKNEQEVKARISFLKKEHHDARHYVYGFCVLEPRPFCRCSDDGEPSNSSGPTILGQIESAGLMNILVIVVRYFGGTKLGVPGLIHAYREAAVKALSRAEIITRVRKKECMVSFTYPVMGEIMRIVSEEQLEIVKQDFAEKCELRLAVRLNSLEKVEQRFADLRNNVFLWI